MGSEGRSRSPRCADVPFRVLLLLSCAGPGTSGTSETGAPASAWDAGLRGGCPTTDELQVVRATTGFADAAVPAEGTQPDTWWAWAEPDGCVADAGEASRLLEASFPSTYEPGTLVARDGVWYDWTYIMVARYVDCDFVARWSEGWKARSWDHYLPTEPEADPGWGEATENGLPVVFQLAAAADPALGEELVFAVEASLQQSLHESAPYGGEIPEDIHLVAWSSEAGEAWRYEFCHVFSGPDVPFRHVWELEPETGRIGFWRYADGEPLPAETLEGSLQ